MIPTSTQLQISTDTVFEDVISDTNIDYSTDVLITKESFPEALPRGVPLYSRLRYSTVDEAGPWSEVLNFLIRELWVTPGVVVSGPVNTNVVFAADFECISISNNRVFAITLTDGYDTFIPKYEIFSIKNDGSIVAENYGSWYPYQLHSTYVTLMRVGDNRVLVIYYNNQQGTSGTYMAIGTVSDSNTFSIDGTYKWSDASLFGLRIVGCQIYTNTLIVCYKHSDMLHVIKVSISGNTITRSTPTSWEHIKSDSASANELSLSKLSENRVILSYLNTNNHLVARVIKFIDGDTTILGSVYTLVTSQHIISISTIMLSGERVLCNFSGTYNYRDRYCYVAYYTVSDMVITYKTYTSHSAIVIADTNILKLNEDSGIVVLCNGNTTWVSLVKTSDTAVLFGPNHATSNSTRVTGNTVVNEEIVFGSFYVYDPYRARIRVWTMKG